jgi:hypothetical protein
MKTKGYWLIAVITLLFILGWTSYAQKVTEPKSQPKWEYMSMTVADYSGIAPLNNAGAQGWELVSVTQFDVANTTKQYFFKRAK